MGDLDYEYSWTIPAEYKDLVLLLLIQDRFMSTPEWLDRESSFAAWLTERGVPVRSWWWI